MCIKKHLLCAKMKKQCVKPLVNKIKTWQRIVLCHRSTLLNDMAQIVIENLDDFCRNCFSKQE